VQQCPRAVADGFNLLPYYLAYRNSNYISWPDGRGRLYQPVKLIIIFDIFNFYWNKLGNNDA